MKELASIPLYKPPKLEVEYKHLATIPLNVAVPALSHRGISTSGIPASHQIIKVTNIFRDDHIFNVRYYWIVGSTGGTSNTGISEGDNIFTRYGSGLYFLGDSMIVPAIINYRLTEINNHIKLHVYNGNTYAINAHGLVLIAEL